MTIYEKNGNLSIWWFPKEFSQSHYGEYQESGTNSCTLISLILADKMTKEPKAYKRNTSDLPRRAVEMFGNAINEGNGVYDRLSNSSSNAIPKTQNLNIPDALNALRNEKGFRLQEWFYTHLRVDPNKENYTRTAALHLAEIFQFALEIFNNSSNKDNQQVLCAALIAAQRTVMFVFEFVAKVVTFYDSHQHGRHTGAAIAQCSSSDVYELTQWFMKMLRDVYSSQPELIEVSFLTSITHQLPRLPSILGDKGANTAISKKSSMKKF